MQPVADAAVADIFLRWLNERLGARYTLPDEPSARVASDGGRELAISVFPVFEAEDDAWLRRRAAVEEQLQQRCPVPVALWLPPEADFPPGDRTEFIRRIATVASDLAPGERGQVEFPVSLTLKKQSDDASYVQIVGGLAPHWARLTGRAYGQYLLDSTAIHRLAEPGQRVADLLEWIALTGNGMKAGSSSEIKAEDAWTLTRPLRGLGTAVIGAPASPDPANGTSVRKAVRAGLRAVNAEAQPKASPRALVFVGIFRSLAEENVTIALRGCDPALYAGFDVIGLVADGSCKPLVGPLSGIGTGS